MTSSLSGRAAPDQRWPNSFRSSTISSILRWSAGAQRPALQRSVMFLNALLKSSTPVPLVISARSSAEENITWRRRGKQVGAEARTTDGSRTVFLSTFGLNPSTLHHQCLILERKASGRQARRKAPRKPSTSLRSERRVTDVFVDSFHAMSKGIDMNMIHGNPKIFGEAAFTSA